MPIENLNRFIFLADLENKKEKILMASAAVISRLFSGKKAMILKRVFMLKTNRILRTSKIWKQH